ncbi:MAG: ribosome assembly RNA-binding protein YhbY [Clostridia bacterium]|nr:ribosome assembly RNA-binding protein YhbY [Clostridia bacterium]
MITGKQRAYLRKLANQIEPIFQIGKGGISDEMVAQLALALEAREIIKIHILETAMLESKACLNELAQRLNAEPVQAIGSKIVIYKQADKQNNRKIELPREKRK